MKTSKYICLNLLSNTVQMERFIEHDQVAFIMYKNICIVYRYRTDSLKSRWEISLKVMENMKAKVLQDFLIQKVG